MNIDGLITLGYSEEQIANCLNMSLADVRQAQLKPSVRLSSATYNEIANEYCDWPISAIANWFKTTTREVLRKHIKYDDPLELYLLHDMSLDDISEHCRYTLEETIQILMEADVAIPTDYLTYKEHIPTMLDEGIPPKMIAASLNCSIGTVYNYASYTGRSAYRPHVKLTDEQWDELLHRLETTSLSYLAKEYGISRATIYNKLKRNDK